MSSIARKFNIRVIDLKSLFHTFTNHDSLCIDETRGAKYRLRKKKLNVSIFKLIN